MTTCDLGEEGSTWKCALSRALPRTPSPNKKMNCHFERSEKSQREIFDFMFSNGFLIKEISSNANYKTLIIIF